MFRWSSLGTAVRNVAADDTVSLQVFHEKHAYALDWTFNLGQHRQVGFKLELSIFGVFGE